MATVYNVMKVLTSHTSPETAYLVPDYPYGRKVRCRIRYWLESDSKRGYRFCSQTEHPTTKVWNAPKKGTYVKIGACMYLDDVGHVQYATLSEYDDADKYLTFAQTFPASPTDIPHTHMLNHVRFWCQMKLTYAQRGAKGGIVYAINGVAQPVKDYDLLQYAKDAVMWESVLLALKPATPEAFAEVQDKG